MQISSVIWENVLRYKSISSLTACNILFSNCRFTKGGRTDGWTDGQLDPFYRIISSRWLNNVKKMIWNGSHRYSPGWTNQRRPYKYSPQVRACRPIADRLTRRCRFGCSSPPAPWRRAIWRSESGLRTERTPRPTNHRPRAGPRQPIGIQQLGTECEDNRSWAKKTNQDEKWHEIMTKQDRRNVLEVWRAKF